MTYAPHKAHPRLRAFLIWIARTAFRLLSHLEVEGLEHVPLQGGVIVATNHMSRIDPPAVLVTVKRDDVTTLVAEKYQENPFFRWIVNTAGGIWVKRGEADLEALRKARQFLQSGGMLGIAPEGTRSRTGGLIEAKTGVAYLADKSGVPVVPCAITGSEKAFRELLHLRRPHIKLIFGQPFILPPLKAGKVVRTSTTLSAPGGQSTPEPPAGEERSSTSPRALPNRDLARSLQSNTDEIMCRIAALLPEGHRGVYADHPALKAMREP